jgi:hypothetical protein
MRSPNFLAFTRLLNSSTSDVHLSLRRLPPERRSERRLNTAEAETRSNAGGRAILDVAIDEMDILPAVWNITAAIGGTPRFGQASFGRLDSVYLIEVCAVTLGSHFVARYEAQRG